MSKIGKALTGGGGSSGSSKTSWSPNAYQKTLLGDPENPTDNPNTVLGQLMGDNGYMSISNTLKNGSAGLLSNYLKSDLANFDYGNANNIAQGYIGVGQNNLQDLANGNLSSGVMQNIADSLRPTFQREVGGIYTDAGARGILNSSRTDARLADASKGYADSMNQAAQSWAGALGNLNSGLINSSVAGIKTAGVAQDAATATPFGLLNAGIGAYNTAQSVLGQGGNQTVKQGTGSMHSGDWLNMGLQVAGMFL